MSAPVNPNRMVVKNCLVEWEQRDGTTVPIRADLRYDSRDPWAVTIVFHERQGTRVEWLFDRNLLNSGVLCASGAGDIMVAPHPTNKYVTMVELTIRRNSEETKHAAFQFQIEDVADFLMDAYEAVPSGQEDAGFDFDAEFAKIAGMWD